MHNILICDDEKDIVKAIKIYLSGNKDYNFFEAYDGQQAYQIIKDNEIHLLLLDIMMPVMDGMSLLQKIREEKINVPVIFLTAKSESDDIIQGLDQGADDYITKPFEPKELLARVSSVLRRYTTLGSQNANDNIYYLDNLKVDDQQKIVYIDDKEVNLTPTEYNILTLLLKNRGQVFSSQQIYEKIWNQVSIGNEQSVAVHIRHLREKIEIDPSNPRFIKVVWGVGYSIRRD